jgi:hypothetical protein
MAATWRTRDGWRTGRRLAAGFAILALAAAISSDFVVATFWAHHPMVTAMLSSLLVVLVSVAVIDFILDRRAERRWGLLAQYALLELAEHAHDTWSNLAIKFNVASAADLSPDQVQHLLNSPEEAPAIMRYLEDTLADAPHREDLRRSLEELLESARQLITRWGVVMTGSQSYARIFDRHVEMFGRLHGLQFFLQQGARRGRQFRSPGGAHADDWFVDNLLSMLIIAAELEGETWALALRVVSPEWWDRRTDELAAAAHADDMRTSLPRTSTP